MQAHILYGVILAGLLGLLLLRQAIILLFRAARSSRFRTIVFQHLERRLLKRRRFAPGLTRLDAALQIIYWIGNGLCNTLGVHSLDDASQRAAALAWVNILPLLCGDRLDYAADILRISRNAYRKIHEAFGAMSLVQMTLHICCRVLGEGLDLGHFANKLLLTVSYPTICILLSSGLADRLGRPLQP